MKLQILFFTIIFGISATIQAGVVGIDNFNEGETNVRDPIQGAPYDQTTQFVSGMVSNILGGERDVQVTRLNATGASLVGINTLDPSDFTGLLAFDNANNALGEVLIQWDGNDSSMTLTKGLGGIDLLDSGNDRIRFDIVFHLSSSPSDFTLSFHDDDSVTPVSVTKQVSASGNLDFLFSEFAGIDFTQIEAIQLEIEVTGPDGDLRIDAINSMNPVPIPEPSSILLLSSTLGLGSWYLRRKRKLQK